MTKDLNNYLHNVNKVIRKASVGNARGVGISLTQGLIDLLKTETEATKKNRSYIVRRALIEYFSKSEGDSNNE